MEVLESINQYAKSIQANKSVYSMQRIGIDIFKNYVNSTIPDIKVQDFNIGMLDRLLLYWLPKNKKYISEAQIHQVLATIGDVYTYMLTQNNINEDLPSILDLYIDEYKRVCKAKYMLLSMTLDPVISIDPIIIGFERYKNKRNKQVGGDRATTYVQSLFKVLECKDGGLVVLAKLDTDKTYKILLEYPTYKYLRVGDIIHAIIRRKLFYVYWEFEELRGYYLQQAIKFLSCEM